MKQAKDPVKPTHHAVIIELNLKSERQEEAEEKAKGKMTKDQT